MVLYGVYIYIRREGFGYRKRKPGSKKLMQIGKSNDEEIEFAKEENPFGIYIYIYGYEEESGDKGY